MLPSKAFAARSRTSTRAVGQGELTVSVKDFGAVGDRVTDDYAAIQAAYDAAQNNGTVFHPPGLYSISQPLTTYPRCSYVGVGSHGIYPGYSVDFQQATPSWGMKASTIQRASGQHGPIFNQVQFSSFRGMIFRVPAGSDSTDVLFPLQSRNWRLEDCVVQGMWAVENTSNIGWGGCYIAGNQFSHLQMGLTGIMLDNRIIGNTFTGTTTSSIGFSTGAGLNIIQGNRFEYGFDQAINFSNGCRYNIIQGNVFDAHPKYAIAFNQTQDPNVISGNNFWRNGTALTGDYQECHIIIRSSRNQIIVGNTFLAGVPDTGGGTVRPRHVIALESNGNSKNKFVGNDVRRGSATSMVVADRFNDSNGALEFDSVDIPTSDAAGTGSDDLATALALINRSSARPVDVWVHEDRTLTSNVSASNVMLRAGTGTPTITAASGFSGIGGIHNVIINGVTRKIGNLNPPPGTAANATPKANADGSVTWS